MLKAALLKKSEAWQNLLIQMGIAHEVMEDSRDIAIPSDSDIFIINGIMDPGTKISLEKADLSKLAIITTPKSSRTANPDSEKSSILVNGEKYHFEHPVTFYTKSERIVKGSHFLPFDFDEVYNSTGSKRKQFYSETKEFPDEIVRDVNLQEIFRAIHNLVVEVATDKKKNTEVYSVLPENKPLFIFRIDTDFATSRDISELYEICQEHNISASWFVDVYSEETIELYNSFKDQEIALHCDRHYVYKKYEHNERNIVRANQKLLKSGIAPRGFAAPFGDWNQSLEEVLFAHDYLYSSEFSFAYDCLPIIRYKEEKKLLQIPVHPINPNRLRRSHFTAKEMINYYCNLIDSRQKRGMPVIIYHHPCLLQKELIPRIFEYVNSKGFNNITMENYAIWWLNRAEVMGKSKSDELIPRSMLKRDVISRADDHNRVYKKTWRYWQHEVESMRGRSHFKKYGYPKLLE